MDQEKEKLDKRSWKIFSESIFLSHGLSCKYRTEYLNKPHKKDLNCTFNGHKEPIEWKKDFFLPIKSFKLVERRLWWHV